VAESNYIAVSIIVVTSTTPPLFLQSVFGVLSVMEGLDSFDDLLTHTKIKKWYYATKQAVHEHQGQALAQS